MSDYSLRPPHSPGGHRSSSPQPGGGQARYSLGKAAGAAALAKSPGMGQQQSSNQMPASARLGMGTPQQQQHSVRPSSEMLGMAAAMQGGSAECEWASEDGWRRDAAAARRWSAWGHREPRGAERREDAAAQAAMSCTAQHTHGASARSTRAAPVRSLVPPHPY
jgi:hypothetical protein